MGNQFDARLIWRRREVWTIDEATGAAAAIRDMRDGSPTPFRWVIVLEGERQEGASKSEQAARNAVRSRIVKMPPKPPAAP